MSSFSEEMLKETDFMKGKDQQKKVSKLLSAFSINQIISRDIILLSIDQYRFGQVQNIICLSPSEKLERLISGFSTIFSKYCLQYFLIIGIPKQQIPIQNNCLTYLLYTISSRTIRSNNESELKKM